MKEDPFDRQGTSTTAWQMHDALTAFVYRLDLKRSTATHAALVHKDDTGEAVVFVAYENLFACTEDLAVLLFKEISILTIPCIDYYSLQLQGSDDFLYGCLDYNKDTCCMHIGSICIQEG